MTGRHEAAGAMRALFIGGPGRSGTSFVADRLGTHPGVVTLKDIELKIFCEKNGLQDLFHALTLTYSPNRAVMALDQFRRMAEALIEGRYGQPALTSRAPGEAWRACFTAFADSLLEDGHPVPQPAEAFLAKARALLADIAALAARARRDTAPTREAEAGSAADHPAACRPLFVEKTPHNLLAIAFLARLVPGAQYLHVMRDPRSIAWSLTAMRWGPDNLATAARWVASYCGAWTRAEADATELGLMLLRIRIEDIAAAPGEAAACLAAGLNLAPDEGLFRGADPALLNRWAAKAAPSERALLDAALGSWAEYFGYERDRIGQRRAPAARAVESG